MSQSNTNYISIQVVKQLEETKLVFKESMIKRLEEMDKQSERIQGLLIRLEDEKLDKQVQIQEMERQIDGLREENDRLKQENARLQQLRLDHIRDLDKAVNYLDKRRRLAAYTLNSPLSPTHDANDQEE